MSINYAKLSPSEIQKIDDKIQQLYFSMNGFILERISYFGNILIPDDFQLPVLSVSNKCPRKGYKAYDYYFISKAIDAFHKKDTDYEIGGFTSILADIQGTIRDLQNGYRFENYQDSFSNLLNALGIMLAEASFSPDLTEVKKIHSNLTIPKRTFYRLGDYDPQTNTITLYHRNILKHFDDVPYEEEMTKLLTGVEITLAHELFHAVQFHLMGATIPERNEWWNCRPKDRPYRQSVIEALATSFEYKWCEYNLKRTEVYEWQKDYIEKDANANDYPEWPYSAAKAFIHKGKLLDYNAKEVFKISLQKTPSHWQNAYDLLKMLDSQIKRPKTFREAVEELL